MTRFSQLLDDVADEQNHSLTSVLMRAKVLAGRIGSDKLTQWLNDELNGYPKDEKVPAYRKIYLSIAGDFWGWGGAQVTNVGLPVVDYPENMRDFLQTQVFADNIGSVEGMLESESETFNQFFDTNLVGIIRRMPGPRIEGFQLQSVHRSFTKAQVRGVLQHIRSKLVDLLLELRKEYPMLEDDEKAERSVSADFVNKATDRVVYNIFGNASMSNHNVNAGRDIKTTGDMIVAGTISESFNHITESSAVPALSQALTALIGQVQTLASQIDGASAKQLAEDADSFVKEAVKPAPRKSILIALGDGLKTSAETVGQLALPVLTAYNNVIKLLSDAGMV